MFVKLASPFVFPMISWLWRPCWLDWLQSLINNKYLFSDRIVQVLWKFIQCFLTYFANRVDSSSYSFAPLKPQWAHVDTPTRVFPAPPLAACWDIQQAARWLAGISQQRFHKATFLGSCVKEISGGGGGIPGDNGGTKSTISPTLCECFPPPQLSCRCQSLQDLLGLSEPLPASVSTWVWLFVWLAPLSAAEKVHLYPSVWIIIIIILIFSPHLPS